VLACGLRHAALVSVTREQLAGRKTCWLHGNRPLPGEGGALLVGNRPSPAEGGAFLTLEPSRSPSRYLDDPAGASAYPAYLPWRCLLNMCPSHAGACPGGASNRVTSHAGASRARASHECAALRRHCTSLAQHAQAHVLSVLSLPQACTMPSARAGPWQTRKLQAWPRTGSAGRALQGAVWAAGLRLSKAPRGSAMCGRWVLCGQRHAGNWCVLMPCWGYLACTTWLCGPWLYVHLMLLRCTCNWPASWSAAGSCASIQPASSSSVSYSTHGCLVLFKEPGLVG